MSSETQTKMCTPVSKKKQVISLQSTMIHIKYPILKGRHRVIERKDWTKAIPIFIFIRINSKSYGSTFSIWGT